MMEYKKYSHVTTFFTILVSSFLLMMLQPGNAEWLNHGGNLANTRSVSDPLINQDLASRLHLRWKFYAGEDITATPAISNGVVFFPSWNGNLYAVNALNGALIWRLNLGQLTTGGSQPPPINSNVTKNYTPVSRTTPTVAGDLLIVGIYGPAVVIAINRFIGRLVWMTRIDPHPLAQITMSGTAYVGGFYVGVSSSEETLSADHQHCCTFQGSLVKLDITSGAILWQTHTLPGNGGKLGGYAGAAVYGSSPAIDVIRNAVYIATGSLYNAPSTVLECQAKQKNQTRATQPDHCVAPDVHSDSILALSLSSGNVGWSKRLGSYDVSYFACLVPGNPSCPAGTDINAEFVEDPMLLTISWNGSRSRDVVVAAQKSGFVWALDRDNGDIVWFNATGGLIWGAATDGRKVYSTNTVNNSNRTNIRSTQSTTFGGAWVALNADTGATVWSAANPIHETSKGPVTLVNDNVLFAGSVASSGPLNAIDAQTGNILWTYDTGAPICGGASVSYGCVYIGHGCSFNLPKSNATWTPTGTSLFAFCPL